MRFKDLNEDGVIVPGVNTTVDVKPGQTEKEAAKFFGNGKPKELHAKARKNSDPNTLYNLGLAEGVELDEGLGKIAAWVAKTYGKKVLGNPKVLKIIRALSKDKQPIPGDAIQGIIDGIVTAGGAAAGAYAATRRNKKEEEPVEEGLLAELWRTKSNIKQSDPLTVLDNLAGRKDNKAFPVKMYDGSTIEVFPSTARRIMSIYLQSEEDVRGRIETLMKTKAGFRELLAKVESVEFDDDMLAEAWSDSYKRSIDCSNPKGFSQKAHCAGKKKNESKDDDEELLKGFDARTQSDLVKLKSRYPHADNILSALLADVAKNEKDSEMADKDQDERINDLEDKVEKLEREDRLSKYDKK